jgi:prepilin-type processing-associated H-X9-DG protein
LYVAGVLAILISIPLIQAFFSVRFLRNRIISASHLRQIGEAILQYENNNHGRNPDSFQTLFLNTTISSDSFVNPNSDDTPADGPTRQAIANQLLLPGHVSYVYLGRGYNSLLQPDAIVAYEKPIRPGFGVPTIFGVNALFADGHVEGIDPAHSAVIIARTTTGPFPVTMPSP